jgi:hypothetical protein
MKGRRYRRTLCHANKLTHESVRANIETVDLVCTDPWCITAQVLYALKWRDVK